MIERHPILTKHQSQVRYFFICRNAYTKFIIATTLQDIRLELAKEEAAEMAAGVVPQHKMSLTGFLTTGLLLEDRQWVIYFSSDNVHS
jgi:hypothetical protein